MLKSAKCNKYVVIMREVIEHKVVVTAPTPEEAHDIAWDSVPVTSGNVVDSSTKVFFDEELVYNF